MEKIENPRPVNVYQNSCMRGCGSEKRESEMQRYRKREFEGIDSQGSKGIGIDGLGIKGRGNDGRR